MADLRTMFGPKPTQQETNNEAQGAAPAGGNESAGTPGPSASEAKAPAPQVAPKVNPFARKVSPPDTSQPTRTAPVTAPPATEVRAAGTAAGPANPQPADNSGSAESGQAAATGVADGAAPAGNPLGSLQSIPSLDALDSIDLSDLSATPPRSVFADETPALKPTREVPPDLEKQGQDFVKLIDNVYDPMILHDANLLGSVIRNIMVELKSKPAFMKLIAPEDVRTWVRAMRESMGLARIKKQEKKAGARGGARKSASVDHDMMADLDSLAIGID